MDIILLIAVGVIVVSIFYKTIMMGKSTNISEENNTGSDPSGTPFDNNPDTEGESPKDHKR